MIKGLTIFDVKEHPRTGQAELVEGPSSPQSNIWINNMLVLSNSRFLVIDKEMNLLVFERNLKPTNEL